jgi:hypothetical protein
VFVIQREGNLEAVLGVQLQDQTIVDLPLLQLSFPQSLHDPHRAAGQPFIESGLLHARQRHPQSGQGVTRQYDTVRTTVDGDEIEAYPGCAGPDAPARQFCAFDRHQHLLLSAMSDWI